MITTVHEADSRLKTGGSGAISSFAIGLLKGDIMMAMRKPPPIGPSDGGTPAEGVDLAVSNALTVPRATLSKGEEGNEDRPH